MPCKHLFSYNAFFDCNYSALMISLLGTGVVIIFKNKLIYDECENKVANVKLGCYNLSIETFQETRNAHHNYSN